MQQDNTSIISPLLISMFYWLSIASTLAVLVSIDYVLIKLWVTGLAQLGVVLTTVIASALVSFDVLSITSIYLFAVNMIRRGGVKWLIALYLIGAVIVLSYYTYTVLRENSFIYIEVNTVGVLGDKYVGYGILMYNLGVLILMYIIVKGKDIIRNLPYNVTLPGFGKGFKGDRRGRERDDSIEVVVEEA